MDRDADRAVERLQAARESTPAVETEHALARLESALFGAPARELALDRYRLLRRLGQGGSGVVYLAHDPQLDRRVAIKLLNATDAGEHGGSRGRARLLREAQAMARSPHPNVVAVYDVGTYSLDNGETGVFLVMEYVEGLDLREWMTTPRPWTDVLDVFVAAGRGLAAAHRMGVTHRDFKPANAIVGDDGRVRVLDFGLARGTGRVDTVTGTSQLDEVDAVALETPLTIEGTVLGTPLYMSPEQHGGSSPEPASDQFAFCVSLWEGLFGARPFAGRTMDELLSAKLDGARAPAPDSPVPSWLVAALARGLAADPADRWPSMDALLEAIVAARPTRRRRWRRVAIAGLLGGGAALGWLALDADSPTCAGASDRVAALWDAGARERTEAAFAATALPYAASSFALVSQRIDRFGEAWIAEHRDACEATTVRREQAADVLDLRMACLERQFRAVDALVAVLVEADGGVVERAADAATELPAPAACANVDALLAEVAAPSDPDLAARVETLRGELARVEALDDAGRIKDALALVRDVAERARALDYAPLVAEAQALLGTLEDHDGHYEQAATTIAAAHETAVACKHDRIAAKAAQSMVFVEGERRGRLDDALRWAQIAEADLQRAGLGHERVSLIAAKATAYRVAGQLREAKQHNLEALALFDAAARDDELLAALLHNNLGENHRDLGEIDEARAQLGIAYDIYMRMYGPDHPQTAMSINNLANTDLAMGDSVAAEKRYRQVLAIRERAYGPDHPMIATALSNLGIALRRNRSFDEARQVYQRALAIMRARFGPNDARLSGVLNSVALVESAQGRHEAARDLFAQGLAIAEASLPADHPNLGPILQNYAEELARLRDHTAAEQSFARCLAIKEKAYGSGHPKLAQSRFDFAKAMDDAGEGTRALQLARAALAQLPVDAAPQLREEIERWLADADRRYARSGGQ